MKKTALLLLLAISFAFIAHAQSILVKNTTGCTQTFQLGAVDGACNHASSIVLTLAPYATQTYSVTTPGIWTSTPPTGATIAAAHIIPPCSSPVPVNVSITSCTSGVPSSNKYICSCGEIIMSLSVLSSTVNELLFQ